MPRLFLRSLMLLVLILSGCKQSLPPTSTSDPSIILLDRDMEACNRSLGGRFVAFGGSLYFDLVTDTLVDYSAQTTPSEYRSVWLHDEIRLYSPRVPFVQAPSSLNNYHVNPGGFLLDVATGVVTRVTTLPPSAQDQLRLDASAAYQRDSVMVQRSPDGQYWTAFGAIYHYDPAINHSGDVIVRSTIDTVTECHRPWEPDSSGIIFLERRPREFGFGSEPGPLRFLPVP